MARRPTKQLDAGRAFFGQLLGIDVAHFGALWHLFTVGHLVSTDLDEVAGRIGCSFADLDLLGTLAIDEDRAMRATDLASALYVSNAVISVRVRRLLGQGLILRERHPDDRRAFALRLTDEGRALIRHALPLVAGHAKIVRFFGQLLPADRDHLVRILGELHQRYDREFVGKPYCDD
ncbi:MAG: MarR family transcriptional regulator [Sphingomonas sp.]